MADQTDPPQKHIVQELGRQLARALGAGPDAQARISPYLQAVETPPVLHTINGTGAALYGRYRPPDVEPLQFTVLWWCLFFVPLLPRGIFLVFSLWPDVYRFYGRVRTRDFFRLYGGSGMAVLLLSTIGYILVRVAWLAGMLFAGGLILLGLRYPFHWVL